MQEATNEAPTAAGRPSRSSSTSSDPQVSKAYVGELDITVNEADLLSEFNQLGKVSCLRIARDVITGMSLGYGFIEYDTSRPVQLVDEISIKGRLVRVMWAQPRAERRKESNYVIYLKNLDRTIGEKTLHDTFSAFGSVISCTLSPASETSIGASIAFDTQDAAKKAIQIVNNSLWNGKKISASHERFAQGDSQDSGIKLPSHTVYVNNLNPEVEDEELRSLSSQFGQVSSASINVNRDGSSKGSGVVKFVRLDSAMEAIQQLDSKEYKGNRLQVSTSHRETKEQIGRKNNPQKTDLISPSNDDKRELYVRNIDDSLDENSIKLAFEKVVTIEQVRIVKQRKYESSKRYGFVTVASLNDAKKLITEMNGKTLGSKPLHISFAHSNYQK